MRQGIFVTGTDTGVGKTFVSVALLHALNDAGVRTAAMKPVATGSHMTPEGLRNADALQLQAAATVPGTYALVNPYAFAPPIAPQHAADAAGATIDIAHIVACATQLSAASDFLLVEGVGGWRVPLHAQQCVSDLAVQLHLPVLLVVGLKVGCINHALLTHAAICSERIPLAAWVANSIDAYEMIMPTIQTLTKLMGMSPLATVPYCDRLSARDAATYLRGAATRLHGQARCSPCPDLDHRGAM